MISIMVGAVAELEFVSDAVPICYVNGKRYELPLGRGEGTLLQFLRGERGVDATSDTESATASLVGCESAGTHIQAHAWHVFCMQGMHM